MHCYIRCIAFHVLFVLGTAGQETCERKSSVYYNHKCFEVIHEDQSWSEARSYCENQGGHLAAIDDKGTDDFIKQTLLKGTQRDVWIGALSRKRWFWADTNTEIEWTSWAVQEPNDAGGQEDRVALWKDFNYEWNDERADTTYLHRWDVDGTEIHGIKSNAICEFEGQKCSATTCVYIAVVGLCYCLNADLSHDHQGYTWDQANAACTNSGARLAHVDNRATMEILIRQIHMVSREQWQFGGNYWIGAVWNRDAPFKWIWETGGTVNYSNWLISPQMNPSIIQAAKLAFKQDFMWMSESITSLHYFICQFAAVVLKPSSGTPTLKPTTAPINNDPTTAESLSTTEQDVSTATSTEVTKSDRSTLTSGIVTEPDTTLTSDIVTEPSTTLTSDIVTEPDTTLTSDIVTEPVTTLTSDIDTEPVTTLTSDIVTEPVTTLTSDIVTEPGTTLTSDIVTEPVTTLTSDLVTEPVITLTSGIVTEPDTTIENAITEHTRITLMSDYLSTRNIAEPNKTNVFATPTKNGVTPRTVTIFDKPSARERKQNRPMWGLLLAIFIPVLLVSIAFVLAWFIYKKYNNSGHRSHLLMKESIYTTVQNPMYKTGLADTPTSGNKAMTSFKGKRPFCNQPGDDVHSRLDGIAEETSFDVNRCHSIEERTVEMYDIVDFTQIRR